MNGPFIYLFMLSLWKFHHIYTKTNISTLSSKPSDKETSQNYHEGKELSRLSILLIFQLIAGISLISAVVANQCYSCKSSNGQYVACGANYKQTVVACDFSNSYCVTVQEKDSSGKDTFYRGCGQYDYFQEGCISTINQGTKCAAACKGDKCNGDANLTDQISTGPSCYACTDSNGNYIDCQNDWSAQNSKTESCAFGDHCFTVQRTYGDVVTYQRGCQTNPLYKDYEEGCVETKQGQICYKGCNEQNCNTHTELSSSASVASVTSLLLAFYCLQ